MILAIVCLILYFAVLVLISWVSVHPPRIPIFLSPGGLGIPQEDVLIPSTDGVELGGWWVESPGATAVVVLAHGYVMNRSELVPVAAKLWQRGVSCLLIDFRAHGLTRKGKSTFGWRERTDVAAAVGYARARVPGAKIAVIGSSMGSAAAALAWAENPALLDGMVLDSCYCSLSSAVLGWWRFVGGRPLAAILSPTVLLGWPMVGFNLMSIDISRELQKLRGKPILVLHGAADNLALPSEAKRNVAALGESAEIVWFEGCVHSEGRWLQPDLYDTAVHDYLRRCGVLQPPA